MTETMKMWLKNIYLHAADEHFVAASNEHLWALGAPNGEAAMLHEMNAEENKEFAYILIDMANEIDGGKLI